MKFDIASIPQIIRIEESPILDRDSIIGWHVTTFDKAGPLGGGFGTVKELARRIAIAESAERLLIPKIKKENLADEFGLDQFPTSCGFAAGFDELATRQRAISEGIERWAWSKWIDEGYLVPELMNYSKMDLPPLSYFLVNQFDSVKYFTKEINSQSFTKFGFPERCIFSVVLGIKEDGIFPGSRVSAKNEDLWQHPLLEAWRHYVIFSNFKNDKKEIFPFGRIEFFGNNKDKALKQLNHAKNVNWNLPEISVLRKFDTKIENLFLWRCLMKNYIGWHDGDETRFVY